METQKLSVSIVYSTFQSTVHVFLQGGGEGSHVMASDCQDYKERLPPSQPVVDQNTIDVHRH